MPQMAPLYWLTLYMYFILIFIIFNIMNYYIFNYNIKTSKNLKSKILLNWKW